MNPVIRLEMAADWDPVRHVHRRAFGQDAEAQLVDELRAETCDRVALVAEMNDRIVGHIVFTDLSIIGESTTIRALSLAPLAVTPQFQKQGIGQALVTQGLEVCRSHGHRIVIVLGDPQFYSRFGFRAELAKPLTSRFSGDDFLALELIPGSLRNVTGRVCYPAPFDKFC